MSNRVGSGGGVDGAVDLYQPLYAHELWGGTRRAGETEDRAYGFTLTPPSRAHYSNLGKVDGLSMTTGSICDDTQGK